MHIMILETQQLKNYLIPYKETSELVVFVLLAFATNKYMYMYMYMYVHGSCSTSKTLT